MKKVKNQQHSNLIQELRFNKQILDYLENEKEIYIDYFKYTSCRSTLEHIEAGKKVRIIKRMIKDYKFNRYKIKRSIKTCQSSYNKFHNHGK